MKFQETALAGAYVLAPDVFEDDRGYFARTFSRDELRAQGLDFEITEGATSFNRRRGTLRGMHYQEAPHAQAKLVSCSRGSLHDVIVDIRPASPTFRAWVGIDLSAANRTMLFIPAGFAHGYVTLEDDTVIDYRMSGAHHAASARGFRWNDPAVGIVWPLAPVVMADRDREYPDWRG